MAKAARCVVCKIRPITKQVRGPETCDVCYDYDGWVNTHSDADHDNPEDMHPDDVELMERCPICHPELDKRFEAKPKSGHTNTATHSRHPHTGCSHPATPKDRGACRKANTWNGEAWVPNATA